MYLEVYSIATTNSCVSPKLGGQERVCTPRLFISHSLFPLLSSLSSHTGNLQQNHEPLFRVVHVV